MLSEDSPKVRVGDVRPELKNAPHLDSISALASIESYVLFDVIREWLTATSL